MRGTLALTCQKGDITLQRDTARANSPMGRFSAVYTGSSETVDGLTAADCGETLLGVRARSTSAARSSARAV